MKLKSVMGALTLASLLFVSEVFALCPADGWRMVPTSGTISEPGLYMLCEDFHQPIRITSSDVRLYCSNRKVWTTLDGTMPTQPSLGKHGIWVENDDWWVSNVMIERCNVAGWDSGIRAGYVSGLRLYHNYAHHNGDGFDLNQSVWIEARDNKAWDNFDDGVDLDLVDWSTFDRTSAYGNKDHGVSLSNFHDYNACPKDLPPSAPGSTYYNHNIEYKNSEVLNNGGYGFNIRRTKDSTFINNKCRDNTKGATRRECEGGGNTFNMPDCES
jgi:hypothetical protein